MLWDSEHSPCPSPRVCAVLRPTDRKGADLWLPPHADVLCPCPLGCPSSLTCESAESRSAKAASLSRCASSRSSSKRATCSRHTERPQQTTGSEAWLHTMTPNMRAPAWSWSCTRGARTRRAPPQPAAVNRLSFPGGAHVLLKGCRVMPRMWGVRRAWWSPSSPHPPTHTHAHAQLL